MSLIHRLSLMCVAGLILGGARPLLAGSEKPGCGATAVYLVLRLQQRPPASLADVSAHIDEATDGSSSLAGLQEGLAYYGLAAEGRRLSLEALLAAPGLVILPIDTPQGSHFVVFGGLSHDGQRIRLISPPESHSLRLEDFRTAWHGEALCVAGPKARVAGSQQVSGPLSCFDARQHLGRIVRPVTKPPEAVFHVRNTSKAVLDLGRPIPSCGCTAATTNQARLLPGQQTEIHCVVEDTGSDVGAKTYTVALPHSAGAPLVLTFTIEYAQSVEVSPGRLYFGHVLRRELPCTRCISVRTGTAGPHDLKILSTTASVPWLTVTSHQDQVVVAAKSTAPLGTFRQVVTVETSAGAVNVPVSGEIQGEFLAAPDPVILGGPRLDEAQIRVAPTPGSRCKLERIQYAFDQRKLMLTPEAAPDGLRVLVHCREPASGPASYPIRLRDPDSGDELTVFVVRFTTRTTQ